MAEKNLLTSQLFFKTFDKIEEAELVHSAVCTGSLQALKHILQASGKQDALPVLLNRTDGQGKPPLFYAAYKNKPDVALYLAIMGANMFQLDKTGRNVFHYLGYSGRVEVAEVLIGYERHLQRQKLCEQFKALMKANRLKKSDFSRGELISSEKHLEDFRRRAAEFQSAVRKLYEDYFQAIGRKAERILLQAETAEQRTLVHYASIGKSRKSILVLRFMLSGDSLEGYSNFENAYNDVQNHCFPKEQRSDPRQFLLIFNKIRQVLFPREVEAVEAASRAAFVKLTVKAVNSHDKEGYTPLHLASFNGNFAAVQYLLKMGADPKARDSRNCKEVLDYAENEQVRKYITSLPESAKRGDQKSFDFLINCGESVNSKQSIFGIAPIHNVVENAFSCQKLDFLKKVIDCGADVNLQDSNGWTPLHHACQKGDIAIVEELLNSGADLNKYSNKGYFPLHVAALNNHAPLIAFLQRKCGPKLNLECRNNEKCTPLHLAAKKGHVPVITELIGCGSNLYAQDIWKWTALHYAAFNMHRPAVQILCEFDSDEERLREIKNTQGKLAKNMSNNEEVRFSFNTIWKASADGNLDIVRKLVLSGTNLNQVTKTKKRTPLILAAMHDRYLVAKFLLENGADPNLKDVDGKKAIDYAVASKVDRKLVDLLAKQV